MYTYEKYLSEPSRNALPPKYPASNSHAKRKSSITQLCLAFNSMFINSLGQLRASLTIFCHH